MDIFYISAGVILIVALLIAGGLLAFSWRRQQSSVTRAFFWMTLNIFLWVLSATIGILSSTAELSYFWMNKFRFIWIATVGVSVFVFATEFTGRPHWITRGRLLALFLVPLITQYFIWFDHSKMFAQVGGYEGFGPFIFETTQSVVGGWFWVHTWYSYLFIILSLVLILVFAIQTKQPFRSQAIVILAGGLLPFLANILTVFSNVDRLMPNSTEVAFTITAVVWAWGLFRYQFLDIAPIARDVVVESMADAVIVLNVQNLIVDVNHAASQLVGKPAHELIGIAAREGLAMWPDLVERFADRSLLETEVSLEYEGQLRYYNLRISPLYNRNRKQVLGRLVALQDITPLKTLMQEMNAYAHTVAHDLKNPIGVIIGYSEMLEEERHNFKPEIRHTLLRIRQTGHTMNNIIEELLLLASVRREDIAIEPINMVAIVNDAMSRYESQLIEKRARVSLPPDWPQVYGHPAWVGEIWSNYISNALKYGGDPPHVELGFDPAENGFVRFWVQDSGDGLSEEVQQGLFEQFIRLETHKAHGHGLGLSIVKRIAEKLGGEVGVESAPGSGSKFYFTLPTTN